MLLLYLAQTLVYQERLSRISGRGRRRRQVVHQPLTDLVTVSLKIENMTAIIGLCIRRFCSEVSAVYTDKHTTSELELSRIPLGLTSGNVYVSRGQRHALCFATLRRCELSDVICR